MSMRLEKKEREEMQTLLRELEGRSDADAQLARTALSIGLDPKSRWRGARAVDLASGSPRSSGSADADVH